MIRVIATDLDGTLLNEHHVLNDTTIQAMKRAKEAGLRLVIATGRSFDQALKAIENLDVECDYIVSSGAEIRDSRKSVVRSGCMDWKDCKEVYEIFQKYDLTYTFCTQEIDYCIGEEGGLEKSLLANILTFNQTLTEAEVRESEFFKFMTSRTRMIPAFETMKEIGASIIKIFAITDDLKLLKAVKKELQGKENLAVASSFENNIEITDVKAQKGIVLKDYIESLGYTMDEVMVFGDSMNDYSMLSMDFGATIAMENGMQPVKDVAKYITKSNVEDGVAYAIDELLKLYQNI